MLTLWMLLSRKRPILPAERVAHTVMQNALNCSSQFIQSTVSNWNMLIFYHTFLNLQAQQSFNLCVLQFGKTLDCRAQIALKNPCLNSKCTVFMFHKLTQANSSLIAQDCFHCNLATYGVLNQHVVSSPVTGFLDMNTDLNFLFFNGRRMETINICSNCALYFLYFFGLMQAIFQIQLLNEHLMANCSLGKSEWLWATYVLPFIYLKSLLTHQLFFNPVVVFPNKVTGKLPASSPNLVFICIGTWWMLLDHEGIWRVFYYS